jgi:hypothetical protein
MNLQEVRLGGRGEHGLDQSSSGSTDVDSCECSDEPLGSIKCRTFPDYLKTY